MKHVTAHQNTFANYVAGLITANFQNLLVPRFLFNFLICVD